MSKEHFHSIIVKSESADLRAQAPFVMDLSYLAALSVVILTFFFSSPALEIKREVKKFDDKVTVVEIPPTKQLTKAPPPSKPAIPVEADDDDDVDDVTINDTDVDITEDIPDIVKTNEEEEVVEFFAIQKKPEIIKKVAPSYPSLAQKAGIEGNVTVTFIVDEKGIPTNIKVLKGHPMLDDAAIEAISQYRFSPGMQRDKPVKVKWSIPIRFKLNN